MAADHEITVNSRFYGGKLKRSWNCRLTDVEGNALTLVGEFAENVTHSDLGLISAGTVSHEYYWLDRWYNVFRFEEPDGTFRNWYCNINMPPVFDGKTLDYVDLDIDILIWPDGRVIVLDEDEFEENAAIHGFSEDVRMNAAGAQTELLGLIERREFPFDRGPATFGGFRRSNVQVPS
jgi:protein associated with RNAse G/E